MKRLTKRDKKGFVLWNQEKPLKSCDARFCEYSHRCKRITKRTCPYLQVLDRLAEYEDTGLEPNEIETLLRGNNV